MNHRSLLLLCAVSAGCLIFSVFAVTQLSHASQTAAKPASEPLANVARTDYPDWPWPRGAHEPAKPDDGQLFHIPGSTKAIRIRRLTGVPARSIGSRSCTLRRRLR